MKEFYLDDEADKSIFEYQYDYIGKKIISYDMETNATEYHIIDIISNGDRIYAIVEEDETLRFNIPYIEKHFLRGNADADYIGNTYSIE